jgi:hypothetical protein
MASVKKIKSDPKYLRFYNEMCRSIDFRYFSGIKDQALEYLDDERCPAEVKSLLGTWLFKEIWMMFKLRGQDKIDVCEKLEPAIEDIRDILPKGEYLKYHDMEALSVIALHFYLERFDDHDRYFILQMLNDVQLVKGYLSTAAVKDEDLKNHFLDWIEKSNVYEQKSNLLDVLLKYYPKDQRVVDVHQKMRFSGNRKDVYSDSQNVHDEEITIEVMKAATELIEWGYENPIDPPPPPPAGIRGWAEGILLRVAEKKDRDIIKCVLDRCSLDTETFCLPDDYYDDGDARDERSEQREGSKKICFTIADVLYTTLNYIIKIPHSDDVLRILIAEMHDRAELCASGYIASCITALQGQEPIEGEEYALGQMEFSYEKSLHAILSYKIFSGFDKINDPDITLGMIDDENLEAKEKYLNFVCRVANEQIPAILSDGTISKKELEECIVRVMEKITDFKGWSYHDEKVVFISKN